MEKNMEMLEIDDGLNAENIEALTNEELISKLQVRLLTARNPASMKQIAEAIDALRRSDYEEQIALTKIDADCRFQEDEIAERKKDRRAALVTGIIGAAIGGACTLAVPAIKGRTEKSYLKQYVQYETNNDVLINQNKKRMPKS